MSALVSLPRDVAEAALALAERVLAAQGDAAEAEVIFLQGSLADALRLPANIFNVNPEQNGK